jgi:mRNA-degrading endonuclease RelE of RelBE toxin-antitoxin system
MNFEVKTISSFEKKAKKLIKKYPSLKSELLILVSQLKTNPEMGISLGQGCYKIRISIASKGKGKSGGARIITCFRITLHTIFLLTIFDKSEQDSLADQELKELLSAIPEV